MKRVVVLGATGSIGTSSLDIGRSQGDRVHIVGVQAGANEEKIQKIADEFDCPYTLTKRDGTDGIKRLIDETKPDIVINGIAGSAGLVPSQIVIDSGIDLALANKETIVMAGNLMFDWAKKSGCRILPVDSEHSAIFTLINQCGKENIDSIVITASGGPFRTWSIEKLATATLADALRHPTWNMGPKITVDSATLGNKGLEVIEAKRLFDINVNKIQVIIHPQSIIHSLVRTKDGIVYGQFSEPDMKHPILQAIDWPDVLKTYMKPFDLTDTYDGKRELTFERPRYHEFPMLALAIQTAKNDQAYPIAYNAANEVAVDAFINGKINFGKIAEVVDKTLQLDWAFETKSLDDVLKADKKARAQARLNLE